MVVSAHRVLHLVARLMSREFELEGVHSIRPAGDGLEPSRARSCGLYLSVRSSAALQEVEELVGASPETVVCSSRRRYARRRGVGVRPRFVDQEQASHSTLDLEWRASFMIWAPDRGRRCGLSWRVDWRRCG